MANPDSGGLVKVVTRVGLAALLFLWVLIIFLLIYVIASATGSNDTLVSNFSGLSGKMAAVVGWFFDFTVPFAACVFNELITPLASLGAAFFLVWLTWSGLKLLGTNEAGLKHVYEKLSKQTFGFILFVSIMSTNVYTALMEYVYVPIVGSAMAFSQLILTQGGVPAGNCPSPMGGSAAPDGCSVSTTALAEQREIFICQLNSMLEVMQAGISVGVTLMTLSLPSDAPTSSASRVGGQQGYDPSYGVDEFGNPVIAAGADGAEWVMPVSGTVGSGYGMRTHPIHGDRRMHQGCDIAAACGTPVVAAKAGTVRSGWAGGYGNTIVIDHGDGTFTRYAHLQGYNVQEGPVQAGQVIGAVGTTGSSTGCHLHFEMMQGNDRNRVDPSQVYPELANRGTQISSGVGSDFTGELSGGSYEDSAEISTWSRDILAFFSGALLVLAYGFITLVFTIYVMAILFRLMMLVIMAPFALLGLISEVFMPFAKKLLKSFFNTAVIFIGWATVLAFAMKIIEHALFGSSGALNSFDAGNSLNIQGQIAAVEQLMRNASIQELENLLLPQLPWFLMMMVPLVIFATMNAAGQIASQMTGAKGGLEPAKMITGQALQASAAAASLAVGGVAAATKLGAGGAQKLMGMGKGGQKSNNPGAKAMDMAKEMQQGGQDIAKGGKNMAEGGKDMAVGVGKMGAGGATAGAGAAKTVGGLVAAIPTGGASLAVSAKGVAAMGKGGTQMAGGAAQASKGAVQASKGAAQVAKGTGRIGAAAGKGVADAGKAVKGGVDKAMGDGAKARNIGNDLMGDAEYGQE